MGTLAYLAVQTKQARIAAETTAKYAGLQATHSIIDIYAKWRSSLLSNPAYPEIIAKANRNEPLTDSERIVLSLIFHDLFYGASYSFSSAESDGSIHEAPADVEYVVRILGEMPCAQSEWQSWKLNVARMNSNFVNIVDAELEKQGID